MRFYKNHNKSYDFVVNVLRTKHICTCQCTEQLSKIFQEKKTSRQTLKKPWLIFRANLHETIDYRDLIKPIHTHCARYNVEV